MKDRKKRQIVITYPPIRESENYRPITGNDPESGNLGEFMIGQISDHLTESAASMVAGPGVALILSGIHNLQDAIELTKILKSHHAAAGAQIQIIQPNLDLDLDLDDLDELEHTL